MRVNGQSHPANTLTTSLNSTTMSTALCTLSFPHRLIFSWYHSHIGTQSLTCHGAIIVLPECQNPADCPCTHVNCGRGGDQVWDPIAGDWSPTIGVDVTVNVDINFPGGHLSISDSTSVSISGVNGGNTGEGSGSSSSWSGTESGVSGTDPSELSSSSGHTGCCKCGCKNAFKRKSRKGKRAIKKRDGSASSTPPYAFDTSCSRSPIPYDEERIIILEDAFHAQDSKLSQEALCLPSQWTLI